MSRLNGPGGKWFTWLEFEVSGLSREGVWPGVDLTYAIYDLIAAGLTDKEAADILAASKGAAGYTSVRRFVADALEKRSRS